MWAKNAAAGNIASAPLSVCSCEVGDGALNLRRAVQIAFAILGDVTRTKEIVMASLPTATGAPVAFKQHPFATAASTHTLPWATPEPVSLRPANQHTTRAESLEVTVLWGSTVLAVAELAPPRCYAVGEVGGAGGAGISARGPVDFALASEAIGSQRRELVSLRGGIPFAIFGAGEVPKVSEDGHEVDARGVVVDCSDVLPGARGIELCRGRAVVIEASGISFRVVGGDRLASVPRAVLGNADRAAVATLGSVTLLQGILLAALAYLTPSLADASTEELNQDRLQLMQQYLHANAERNREAERSKPDSGTGERAAPAEAARGPSGKSGRSEAAPAARRLAIKGDHAERALGRSELRKEAETFGMVGMLSSMNASEAPSTPWGAELAAGSDQANAHGDLFSPDIGDAFGHGLGVSGTEQGGGGKGSGVSVSFVGSGTCVGVSCLGDGNFGSSLGKLGRGHRAVSPRVRMAHDVGVSGRLPSDVIQRIVRQNFGRFRQCYEVGLRSNPNLEGRVTARVVIGRDGAVSNVSAGGDLPDASVSSCVASAFYGLSFPAPENGIVTVSYPILLTPG